MSLSTQSATVSGAERPRLARGVVGLVSAVLARVRSITSGSGEIATTQRNAVLAFAVRVVSAALLYLSQIILARMMGTFEYGVFVYVWTWVLILGGLSHLGFGVTMMRLLPEYRETGQTTYAAGLIATGRRVALGVGLSVATIGLLTISLIGDRLAHHVVLPLYLALFCIPAFALTDLQDGIGRARGWMGAGLVPPYILRPVLLLCATLGAWLVGLPMDARTAVAAAIVATYGAAIVQVILIERRLATDSPKVPNAYAPRLWAQTALPLLITYAAELVIQNVDILVVSALMTPVDVGKYFAAAKTMSLVMFIHYAVGSAVANRFSALKARGDAKELEDFVRTAVSWTFWPSLAAALGILILGKPLLWLFSPSYVDAYPVMMILVAGFLVRASVGPAEFLLNMLGQQKISAIIQVATAALSAVLNVMLVSRFGLIGAAMATALALSLAAIVNCIVARQRLGFDISILSRLTKR